MVATRHISDPLAVCACRNPLCSDAEHAVGICARCVKLQALRSRLMCPCGAKLAVTTEVFTGWCVPCQARPMGARRAAFDREVWDERSEREYHDDCMHDAEERAHAGECSEVSL